MLRVSIIDANPIGKDPNATLQNLVYVWLTRELQQARTVELAEKPSEADVIFLYHIASRRWRQDCARALKKAGIEPLAEKRGRTPYVISGGCAAIAPLHNLEIANAIAIGEAYTFVREVLAKRNISEVQRFCLDYPHAIEREQVTGLEVDSDRPWLLTKPAPKLASPDPYIDWKAAHTPVIIRNTAEMVLSKGCKGVCGFCVATYMQTWRYTPDMRIVRDVSRAVMMQGYRPMYVSNDLWDIPGWQQLPPERMFGQSVTVRNIMKPEVRTFLSRHARGIQVLRIGIEGVSERIRKAFGKPISDEQVIDCLRWAEDARVRTVTLYFVIDAPGETNADWEEMHRLHTCMCRAVKRLVVSFKLKAFEPTPPAPLARFLPCYTRDGRDLLIRRARSELIRNPRIVIWPIKHPETAYSHAEDTLGTPAKTFERVAHDGDGRSYDLLPSPEHAARGTWEIVEWPIPAEKRWQRAEAYRKALAIKTIEV